MWMWRQGARGGEAAAQPLLAEREATSPTGGEQSPLQAPADGFAAGGLDSNNQSAHPSSTTEPACRGTAPASGISGTEGKARECCVAEGRSGGGQYLSDESPWLGSKRRLSPTIVNLLFWKRFWGLMRIAKAENAILVVILSSVDLLVTAQVGKIPGSFIFALVNGDLKMFWSAMQYAVLWYCAGAACSSSLDWAGEFLTYQWRKELTRAAHRYYVNGPTLYALSRGAGRNRHGEAVWIDNPDQRIAQEVGSFARVLNHLVSKTVFAPLMATYYSVWVYQLTGWQGLVSVYAFFVFGATMAQLILNPIAALIGKSEHVEADFRMSHIRLKENAESIALYRSAGVEGRHLEKDFDRALHFQMKLVERHLLLSLATRFYEHMGTVLNYVVLAVPVLGGALSVKDKGELAQLISVASFAVLQLLASFTHVVNASKELSDLAGYAGRVAELFEAIGLLPITPASFAPRPSPPPPNAHRRHACEREHSKSEKRKGGLWGFFTYFLDKKFPPRGTGGKFSNYGALVQRGLARGHRGAETAKIFEVVAGDGGKGWPAEVSPSAVENIFLSNGQILRYAVFLVTEETLFRDTRDKVVDRSHRLVIDIEQGNDVLEEYEKIKNRLCNILREKGYWTQAQSLVEKHENKANSDDALDAVRKQMQEQLLVAAELCTHAAGGTPEDGEERPEGRGRVYTTAPLEVLAAVLRGFGAAADEGAGRAPGGREGGGGIIGRGEGTGVAGMSRDGDVARSEHGRDQIGGEGALSRVCEEVGNAFAWDKGSKDHSMERDDSSGQMERETQFMDNLGDSWRHSGDSRLQLFGNQSDEAAIVVENMTLKVPGSHRILVKDLSFCLRPGESIVIMGPSGSGKSSLIRGISGLWPLESGRVTIPANERGGVLYLPQKPLLARGGLAAQITYPESPPVIGLSPRKLARLRDALEKVGMLKVLHRAGDDWEAALEWDEMLSPGEQQCLSLARVLYHRPPLAVLDEGTSAINADAEARIYKHIKDLGVALLSVSHQPALRQWHDRLLQLQGDHAGAWSISTIHKHGAAL